MNDKTKKTIGGLVRLIAIVLLAVLINSGIRAFIGNYWLIIALTFLGTKIVYDIGWALFAKENPFFYFEDYLRDILVYMVVVALAMAVALTVHHYVGGVLWEPLLAAALAWVWR